jgi:hypothetical protein
LLRIALFASVWAAPDALRADETIRPVTGPNSFLNLPGADAKPGGTPPPPPPPAPKPVPPLTATQPAPKIVKTPEDLLRDMPLGTGLYSAGHPNPAGFAKANAAFAKKSVGRPVEVQIAVASVEPFYDRSGRRLVSSTLAQYRHRLDDIRVKVEVVIRPDEKGLLDSFKPGSVVSLSGAVGGAEFRSINGKAVLVLIVHGPAVM